jgi:lysophospholipase L1-like esterase
MSRPARLARLAGTSAAALLLVMSVASCKVSSGAAQGSSPGSTAQPAVAASRQAPARQAATRQDAARQAGAYAALGDSYTSGPLVPDQGGHPLGCLRSDEDYPSQVAAAIRPSSFTDVSCYGASTANMTSSQQTLVSANPPQFSVLSAATTLVTVQLGGDDIGFSHITLTCGVLSLTSPLGSPCMSHYASGGADLLAQAISRTAPKIEAVLRGIRARAPHARILLVGYPAILPASGNGCWPRVPVARGDVPYLRNVEISLNAMLASAAASNGAGYVDTYAASIGHDACQASGVRWIEGLVPTSLAVPMHPNALGEKGMARAILAALH